MKRLWFIMPAYRRYELAELCLEHLRRTVDGLLTLGIAGQCVVISDEQEHLESAARWGFYGVEQENVPLGRKFNDGFELAAAEGADYFVPLGSDNWVDWRMFTDLPTSNTIVARRQSTLIHEDGDRACTLYVKYDGGDGIRIMPRQLLAPLGFRPAKEHARRAVDTSIVENLKAKLGWGPRGYYYADHHAFQVLGWQSHDEQLNTYDACRRAFGVREIHDPWGELAAHYPGDLVEKMHELYLRRAVPA